MTAQFQVYLLPVTPIQQNCRIFVNKETNQAFVVDPGGDAQALYQALTGLNVTLQAIVLTHGHFDHIGGVEVLRSHFPGVPVYGPFVQDEFMFDNVVARAAEFGLNPDEFANYNPQPEKGDRFFSDAEVLELCGLEFEVRHTPGHSPGHAVLINHQGKFVLCGDLLFQNSVGRTDLVGGSFSTLKESVERVIWPLDGYALLSGHGPDTTVDHEKRNNPYVGQHLNS